MRKRTDSMEARLQEHLVVDGATGCMVWTAGRHPFGYGTVTSEPGFSRIAHRLAWELANGPIPDGLWVLHSCDNPPCCNIEHLHLGTAADNNREKAERGRSTKGILRVTHCTHGHEYTDENTRITCRGQRECRICYKTRADYHNALAAQRKAARKAGV